MDELWVVYERINNDRFAGIYCSPQDFWRYLMDHPHLSSHYHNLSDMVLVDEGQSVWNVCSTVDFTTPDYEQGGRFYHYAGDTLFIITKIVPIRWPQ